MDSNDPIAIDLAVLQRLGARLAAHRLARNLTQAQLAEAAGVSKRTVERLEAGATATQLGGFLRVCAALGLGDAVDRLLPELPASPLAQLRLGRQARKRASGESGEATAASVAEPPPTGWTWDP